MQLDKMNCTMSMMILMDTMIQKNNNHDLKKQYDESIDQYFYRICTNKELFGLSWNDIADIFNKELGVHFGESKYRKDWASFFRIFSANEEQLVNKQYLNEIRTERFLLEKERKKLQADKVEYNKWLREHARDELIVEKFVDAVKRKRKKCRRLDVKQAM